MRNFITYMLIGVLAVPQIGCLKIDTSDLAQAVSDAELAGNLAVFSYFAVNKDDMKNAQKYVTALNAIDLVVTGTGGTAKFSSLADVVNDKLAAELTGEDAAFLPGAKALSRILLMEMDRKIPLPEVELSDNTKSVLEVVKAFLKGAKAALTDFAS